MFQLKCYPTLLPNLPELCVYNDRKNKITPNINQVQTKIRLEHHTIKGMRK